MKMSSRSITLLVGLIASMAGLGAFASTTRGFRPIATGVAYAAFALAFAAVVAKGGAGVRRAAWLFAATLLVDAFGVTAGRTPGAMAVSTLAAVWMLAGWTAAAFWSVRDVAGILSLPFWGWTTYAIASIAADWCVRGTAVVNP